jgi:replicative DNA helicase
MDQFRNTDLEISVLSYELRKDFSVCDMIEREYFSIKPYRVFHDIVCLHRSVLDKKVLFDLVSQRLKDMQLLQDYVKQIYKKDISKIGKKAIISYISRMRELYMLRFSRDRIEDIMTALEEKNIDEVRKLSRKISLVGTSNKKVYEGEYLEDFEERKRIVKARKDNKNMGMLTGIRKFDHLSGGIMPTELAIITAESGKGKTIALENFSAYPWLYQNANVIFFTIEMPKIQVQLRLDSLLASIEYSKFRRGNFNNSDLLKWEKKIQELRMEKQNYLEIVAMPRGCSAQDIEAEADRIQDIKGKEVDLIAIDYLNIMKSNSSKSNSSKMEWGSQTDIAIELTEVAKDFCNGRGVAIWTANQLKDEAENMHLVKKRHLKYARGILENASVVAALLQDQDDELEDIMRLQFLKLRDISDIEPIVIRPNFDIMLLDESRRAPKSLSEIRKVK